MTASKFDDLMSKATVLAGIDAQASFRHLVWAGMPLVGVFGTSEAIYLAIASSIERTDAQVYFAFPFSRSSFEDFASARVSTLGEAIRRADGKVLYTEDLITFAVVGMDEMPEDDTVVLSNSWADFEAMFTEETPAILAR